MRFQFLHTHANGCYFLFFFFFIVYSHSNEHEAVSHTVVLIFIPLITADVKQFFRCLTIYIFSLGKNVYLNPLSIFELGCSCCWVVGVLFISWILLTYQICGLQMFFPILWVVFSTLWIMSFDIPNFLILIKFKNMFFLLLPWLWYHIRLDSLKYYFMLLYLNNSSRVPLWLNGLRILQLSLLWLGFDPLPRNFRMSWVQPKGGTGNEMKLFNQIIAS